MQDLRFCLKIYEDMNCIRRVFFTLAVFFPFFVHGQLIDNRSLPPEDLLKRAPFIPTDRAAVRTKDTANFYVMDNADLVTIQDYPDNGVTEVTMLGNVRIRFQNNYIRAERVIVTVKNSVAINLAAYGSVEFTLNNGKYLAEGVNYQPQAKRGVMYDVRSTLGNSIVAASALPWFYRAEKATIQGDERFILENVIMSTSDARFEHFSIFAKKVWFIQGKLTLAFGIQYKVGQAGFIWLPAYMQMEGGAGISTSFGSEPNTGYYFINNLGVDSAIGKFNFGFDFYQRLGQYFKMDYTAPSVGPLKEFKLQVDMANDTRVATNLPFGQWLDNGSGNRAVINQFAWHYKLNASITTNDFNLKFASEHLNDPFFLRKYSYRSRFDNSDTIDVFSLINQGYPAFYDSYTGDLTPENDTLTHSIAISAGKLSIGATLNMGRLRNEEEKNPFLNKAYFYKLRSMTLPEISVNPGSLTLANYEIKKNDLINVVDSRGRKYSVLPNQLAALKERLSNETKNVVIRIPVTNEGGEVSWSTQTNKEAVRITNETETAYMWLAVNSTVSGNFGFTGSQTFGSNIAGVNDLNNTNWRIVNDNYKHRETGQMSVTINALNNLITVGNSLDGNYQGQLSSFNTDYTNNKRSTTFNLDYKFNASVRSNFVWLDEEVYRMALPVDTSFSYSQPLVRFNAFDDSSIKEGSLSWATKLGWEAFQWRRSPLVKFDGEIGIAERYRFPTDAQRSSLSTSTTDPYITDKIYSRLKLSGALTLWWVKFGTSADIDLLETTTNNFAQFAKQRYASDPVLNLAFTPDSTFHYLPSLTYNYYIHSNQSANLDFRWTVAFRNLQVPKLYPFIYEISEIGFVFNYHHDFVALRNSSLELSFVLAIKFTRFLTFRFSSTMRNSKLYLYYNDKSLLAGGEELKSFWQDLGDSLKIWDRNALLRTSFKLQGLNFELIHDLQTWDMRLMFQLRYRTDSARQVSFWEPFIGVAFTMKGSSAANIFPEFSRKLVPREYQ